MKSSILPPGLAVTAEATTPRLIDAKAVGIMLGCSWRHVLRLADAGKLPWGCKLGSLRRWDIREIESFLANGCKPVRKAVQS